MSGDVTAADLALALMRARDVVARTDAALTLAVDALTLATSTLDQARRDNVGALLLRRCGREVSTRRVRVDHARRDAAVSAAHLADVTARYDQAVRDQRAVNP